ncbi:MAG TPA: DUF4276 family protein [Candidatus Acidoferrum sp.]|nr:DUF4276 family protein [Candidatus Acidoferrum sp.]
MARLLIHVEGQTEEDFVNEVLQDHLVNQGYESVGARIVGNNRLRRRRGGIRRWPSVRKDIINHLRQDSECIATTIVDFYGLPKQGDGAWPGRAAATGQSTQRKASCVEKALLKDIVEAMGVKFDPKRFVPFVMMHEFEGLLFSDCAAFGRGIGQPSLEPRFRHVRDEFATPEDINDSPITAPSKRVENIVPGYEKPLLGTLAVLEIGLAKIRAECPHFAAWLDRLESLVN